MKLTRWIGVCFSVFAAASALACTAPTGENAAQEADEPIVGGLLETGYLSAVTALASDPAGHAAVCTGVVIDAKVVVTAAHCVDAFNSFSGSHSGTTLTVLAGAFVVGAPKARIVRMVKHPGYTGNDTHLINDVAVLYLDKALTGVTPATIATTLDFRLGCGFKSVGYGQNVAGAEIGTTFQRRSAFQCVAGSDHGVLLTSGQDGAPCFGDSGGPLFMPGTTNHVVAIASSLLPGVETCAANGGAVYTPLYEQTGFIKCVAEYTDANDVAACVAGRIDAAQVDDPTFDLAFYKGVYPDLQNAFGSNDTAYKTHWVNHGRSEGRVASPVFDQAFYRSAHRDVTAAFGDNAFGAQQHWIEYGTDEGRSSSFMFDASYYVANNGDVAAAFGSSNYDAAIAHFIAYGLPQGRRSSATFDVKFYFTANPDVSKSCGKTNYMCGFVHYYRFGRFENRRTAQ